MHTSLNFFDVSRELIGIVKHFVGTPSGPGIHIVQGIPQVEKSDTFWFLLTSCLYYLNDGLRAERVV